MTILIIFLVALTGATSYTALDEHKQLAAVHAATIQQQATIGQLQTSISSQQAAIAKEAADKVEADAAAGKTAQIRSQFELAASDSLNQNPPAVPAALAFNSFALSAGDPALPATVQAAQALAAANAKEQAAEIAELQGELKQLSAAKDTAEANFQADHAQVGTLATQNGTLTAQIGTVTAKIGTLSTQNDTLTGKLGVAADTIGRYVFWIGTVIAGFFGLTWIFPAIARDIPDLAPVGRWIAHVLFHPLAALFEDVIDDVNGALTDEQTAHTETKAQLKKAKDTLSRISTAAIAQVSAAVNPPGS
jgi:uncharacterized coiled-coil protein SlyX